MINGYNIFYYKRQTKSYLEIDMFKKTYFFGGGGNVLNKKLIFCLGNNNKKSFKNISLR